VLKIKIVSGSRRGQTQSLCWGTDYSLEVIVSKNNVLVKGFLGWYGRTGRISSAAKAAAGIAAALVGIQVAETG
jgi:hypothetical protein